MNSDVFYPDPTFEKKNQIRIRTSRKNWIRIRTSRKNWIRIRTLRKKTRSGSERREKNRIRNPRETTYFENRIRPKHPNQSRSAALIETMLRVEFKCLMYGQFFLISSTFLAINFIQSNLFLINHLAKENKSFYHSGGGGQTSNFQPYHLATSLPLTLHFDWCGIQRK